MLYKRSVLVRLSDKWRGALAVHRGAIAMQIYDYVLEPEPCYIAPSRLT